MPGSAPPSPSIAVVLVQVLYYLGLSTAFGIGMCVAALTVSERQGGSIARRVRGFALPTVALVAITAVLHLVTAPGGRGSPDASRMVLQTGGYVVVVLCLIGLRLRGSTSLAAVLVVSAAITAALPELPTSVPSASRAVTIGLTLAHVFGALTWVGGLVVLAAAGLADRRRRHTPDGSADEWLHTWERFTVAALYAVGALIVSGAWLSWNHVGTPAQLFGTPYGRALVIKLILVGLLLAAGAYNVRVLIPRIHKARRRGADRTASSIAVHHFPVVVAVECVIATAVLAVVPFLRSSARAEAGQPGAGPFELETLGVGVVMTGLVAACLWLGTRSTSDTVAAENN